VPKSGPSLISHLLQVDYTQQWSTWSFPHGKYNATPPTPNLEIYVFYSGFNFKADRLAFVNGNQIKMLDLCYHSNNAPQRCSTNTYPEYPIADDGHHWDSYEIQDIAAEPQFIQQAHLRQVTTVKKRLRSFSSWKPQFEDEL